jgi:hypothetical protein
MLFEQLAEQLPDLSVRFRAGGLEIAPALDQDVERETGLLDRISYHCRHLK